MHGKNDVAGIFLIEDQSTIPALDVFPNQSPSTMN